MIGKLRNKKLISKSYIFITLYSFPSKKKKNFRSHFREKIFLLLHGLPVSFDWTW